MAAKTATGSTPCGFCATRHHFLCPGTVQNGAGAANSEWTCPCSAQGHTLGGQPPRVVEITRLPASARPLPRPAAEAAAPVPAIGEPVPVAAARPRKAGKGASPFPEGVCSPYQFRSALVERGLVPASFRPQTVYTWVTQAAKGGTFPVRWYGADGAIVGADAAGARPGVSVDEAVAWYAATQQGKAA